MPDTPVDILENDFQPDVLETLLHDHTTQRNILWATHDYEQLGEGYQYADEIRPEHITGKHGQLIKPRVLKSKELQTDRAKDMAEVFTPSWLCNAQNNLVDEALPEDMNWQAYVRLTCLEMTCGEAPYLVSRYDATTGEPIPLSKRIGLLDRKLRLVCEHVHESTEWFAWVQVAYQNTYGYEWQGDNLLLAREALLLTFIEYHQAQFGKAPSHEDILTIARIVSWNLWQMDGLKGVVPDSCHEYEEVTKIPATLFEPAREERKLCPCPGCKKDDLHSHNGTYCLIHDWQDDKTIRYVDLIK